MKRKTEKKRMEASKAILGILFLLLFLVLGFSMFMTYTTGNMACMSIMLIGSFILCSIGVGFYYWKAKVENVQKIRNERIETGNHKVDMSDVMSIKDDSANIMASAFGSGFISSSSNEYSTYFDTETYQGINEYDENKNGLNSQLEEKDG